MAQSQKKFFRLLQPNRSKWMWLVLMISRPELVSSKLRPGQLCWSGWWWIFKASKWAWYVRRNLSGGTKLEFNSRCGNISSLLLGCCANCKTGFLWRKNLDLLGFALESCSLGCNNISGCISVTNCFYGKASFSIESPTQGSFSFRYFRYMRVAW